MQSGLLARSIASNVLKFFRPFNQATLAAGLIVEAGCGVGDLVDRVASQFASALLGFFATPRIILALGPKKQSLAL